MLLTSYNLIGKEMSEKVKLDFTFKVLLLATLISFSTNVYSWEEYEHQILADLALDSSLSFCEISFNDSLIFFPGESEVIKLDKMLWQGMSFGILSATFSEDDISESRCQSRGYTINEQLQFLSREIIEASWENIKQLPDDIKSISISNQNVIFNYMLYHIMALRFAELSSQSFTDSKKYIRYALIYESVAQGYLSDAFSSGHLLLFNSDFFAPLNNINIRIAHDFYCSEGVYVLNANGDCWRTFGDRLMQWYEPSFNNVFQACTESIRELLLVYFVRNKIKIPSQLQMWVKSISSGQTPEEQVMLWLSAVEGKKYYSEIKMPALLCIPIPIAASWSIRTEETDRYGIHRRKHYPQLKEEKFHDPDFNWIDKEFLYSRNSIPSWMIPELFTSDTLQNLIRYHPDVASVRYTQNRSPHPAYEGLLISAGGTTLFKNDENKFGASFGIGWGIADDLLFYITKPSLIVSSMYLFNDNPEWIIMADLGFGLNACILNSLYPRIEFGYTWGSEEPNRGSASKLSFGLDSETVPLGFTYAGLTFRLKYSFIFFHKTLYYPALEIVLH